jgi:hypothetical protein
MAVAAADALTTGGDPDPLSRSVVASAPNWAEMVAAVGSAVLAVGVLIAVVSLRELRRDRHLQWIFEIGRRWEDEDLKQSRLALRAYGEDGEELALKFLSWLEAGRRAGPDLTAEIECLQLLPDFFEDVALMRRFGRLDIGLVWQSLSGPVNLAWKSWQPAVMTYRQIADAEAWTEFEDLADELAAYELKRTKRWWILYRWLRSLI